MPEPGGSSCEEQSGFPSPMHGSPRGRFLRKFQPMHFQKEAWETSRDPSSGGLGLSTVGPVLPVSRKGGGVTGLWLSSLTPVDRPVSKEEGSGKRSSWKKLEISPHSRANGHTIGRNYLSNSRLLGFILRE